MEQDQILSVDKAFIKMFEVKSMQGNLEDLEKPNTVFISEDFAKKHFGDQDPMGKQIHIEALQYVRDLGPYEVRLPGIQWTRSETNKSFSNNSLLIKPAQLLSLFK